MLPLRFAPKLRITTLGLACVALGLLIWSKLMLVTRHPRTAVAEPAAQIEPRPSQPATAIAAAELP